MLLRCENRTPLGAESEAATGAWLRPETLESLTELNDLCLALLADQAAVGRCGAAASPLLRETADLWGALDAAARRRAAACPYLVLDAGFADAARWRVLPAIEVGDAGRGAYSAFFTVPGTLEVARQVFTYAWHLARAEGAAARLLLGMPGATAALVARCTLRQILALAEGRCGWLRPRWPSRVQVWRELLRAAAAGEAPALERARLHGLTLLAAETRRVPVSLPQA